MSRSSKPLRLLLVGEPSEAVVGRSALVESLVSAHPDMELVTDANGIVLYANAEANARLAGGEPLIGQRLELHVRSGLEQSVVFEGPAGVRKCSLATTRVPWPAQAPSATSQDSLPAASAPLWARAKGAETLLLVDDDPAVRRATARVLRGLGYGIVEAANGDEACRILNEQPHGVSVVVTDMLMPGMTGLDIFDFVQEHFPGIPVLVVTGESDEPDLPAGLRLLHKPFHPKELATTLRDVLDRSG